VVCSRLRHDRQPRATLLSGAESELDLLLYGRRAAPLEAVTSPSAPLEPQASCWHLGPRRCPAALLTGISFAKGSQAMSILTGLARQGRRRWEVLDSGTQVPQMG
jgi:hypothetical protein